MYARKQNRKSIFGWIKWIIRSTFFSLSISYYLRNLAFGLLPALLMFLLTPRDGNYSMAYGFTLFGIFYPYTKFGYDLLMEKMFGNSGLFLFFPIMVLVWFKLIRNLILLFATPFVTPVVLIGLLIYNYRRKSCLVL